MTVEDELKSKCLDCGTEIPLAAISGLDRCNACAVVPFAGVPFHHGDKDDPETACGLFNDGELFTSTWDAEVTCPGCIAARPAPTDGSAVVTYVVDDDDCQQVSKSTLR